MMCLMALSVQAQQGAGSKDYVDLGLPSGTLWKSTNEKGFYTYNQAQEKFSGQLPTKEQLLELKEKCQWTREGSDYRVTGPNGNSIVLPAAGARNCREKVTGVGTYGYYWSGTRGGSKLSYALRFGSKGKDVEQYSLCFGFSVRLVKK